MPAPQIKTKPKKPAPPTPPKPVVKVAGKEALTVKRVPKDFKIVDWDRAGKKVILYGDSGMGKTTLAMLLDNPVFIGTDDGGGVMRHPVTGKKLKTIEGVSDFNDIRDALHSDIFDPYKDIVIDTITEVQRWAVAHMLENIPRSKQEGGGKAVGIKDYYWYAGYTHLYEVMELLVCDLNKWVHKDKNIILLAQSNVAKMNNTGGMDYLQAAPDLYHGKNDSVLNLITQWSDHIFRIDRTNLTVDSKTKKATAVDERAVYVHGKVEFMAKSRTISQDYPCVEFKDKTDDSIWRLLFDGGE